MRAVYFFLFCFMGWCFAQSFNQLSFDVPTFSDSIKDRFDFVNSNIAAENSSVRLTRFDAPGASSGSVWYKELVHVKGMKVRFKMYISTPKFNSSEGIVFVIQNGIEGTKELKSSGAGLGYASSASTNDGIQNSVAIEFDCISNPVMNDPDSLHISVHSLKKSPNSANENTASLAKFTFLPVDFCNSVSSAELTYEPNLSTGKGDLKLTLDRVTGTIIDLPILLDEYITLNSNSLAYIGFTASTGGGGANQEILSWSYEFLGKVTPAKCTASGTGLSSAVAGQTAGFTVTTVDQYGNRYPIGGSTITISINGPTTVIYDVVDKNDGTYSVSYSTTVSGDYTVLVIVNSVAIGNAQPSSVRVSPDVVDPAKSRPIGTVPESTQVNVQQTFKIQTYDQYSNLVLIGGANVVATLQPVQTGDISQVIDNGDGTYSIRFTVFKATSYSLSVTVNGTPVLGSPFRFVSSPGPLDQTSCVVEGYGSTMIAGETQVVLITSYDEFGNPIPTGGSVFEVYLSPNPSGTNIVTTDFNNGVYEARVYAQTTGSYQLNIKLDGKAVAKSPYSLRINPDAISVPNCVAQGTSLTVGMAGVTSSFDVITKDRFDNTITSRATIQFTSVIVGPINITATSENRADGTVGIRYVPTISGKYTTYVTAQGQYVKNTPATTSISTAAVSAPDSYVIDPTYPFKLGQARKISYLQVQSSDQYKNLIQIGGATVVATIISSNPKRTPINATVTDNQNGTYTVTYIPEKDQTGDYVLTILLNNINIQDSPFGLDIAGVDKTNTVLIAVGVPIIVICVAVVVGLAGWKRYQKTKGYQAIEQNRSV